MDAQRRIDLINDWTENENKIVDLLRQLEEANQIKKKIEDEIPSLRDTGKWEVKFISPKKSAEVQKVTTYKGQQVSASKKRKLKSEEALKRKIAKMRIEGGDQLGLQPSGGLDKTQNFANSK